MAVEGIAVALYSASAFAQCCAARSIREVVVLIFADREVIGGTSGVEVGVLETRVLSAKDLFGIRRMPCYFTAMVAVLLVLPSCVIVTGTVSLGVIVMGICALIW
jgi:hypothetical protein